MSMKTGCKPSIKKREASSETCNTADDDICRDATDHHQIIIDEISEISSRIGKCTNVILNHNDSLIGYGDDDDDDDDDGDGGDLKGEVDNSSRGYIYLINRALERMKSAVSELELETNRLCHTI